jgi:DNA repair protein RecO (recombination protein O)
MARSYKTEAVVLRSLRLGEADRVLHLYTRARGRIGAVAKGIRRTTSRFGARLEPLSHVELLLHQGSGELQTVTGVHLVRPHRAAREHPYRLGIGLVGVEAMLRLFTEQEANERAFAALVLSAPPARRAQYRCREGRLRQSTGCCGDLLPTPARSRSASEPRGRRCT